MGDFEHLLEICYDIASEHPGQVVFIGGVAAFLHVVNSPLVSAYAEATHDGDFYVSLAGLHELRDTDELVSNTRLRKHSFTRAGFDFDVYGQYTSGLIVPFEDTAAFAVSYERVNVAAIEHLFALKLAALADRSGSSKGAKDVRDLARLSLVEQQFRPKLLLPYLRDEHLEILAGLSSRSEIVGLAKGNVKEIKAIRHKLEEITRSVESALQQAIDPDDPLPPDKRTQVDLQKPRRGLGSGKG